MFADMLVFICRAGGEKKCRQAGRVAMRLWAQEQAWLERQFWPEVHDLQGWGATVYAIPESSLYRTLAHEAV